MSFEINLLISIYSIQNTMNNFNLFIEISKTKNNRVPNLKIYD